MLLATISLYPFFSFTYSFCHDYFISFIPSFIRGTILVFVPCVLSFLLLLPVICNFSSLCRLLPPVIVIAYCPYGSHWSSAAECFALVMCTWFSDIMAPSFSVSPPFPHSFYFSLFKFMCVVSFGCGKAGLTFDSTKLWYTEDFVVCSVTAKHPGPSPPDHCTWDICLIVLWSRICLEDWLIGCFLIISWQPAANI